MAAEQIVMILKWNRNIVESLSSILKQRVLQQHEHLLN